MRTWVRDPQSFPEDNLEVLLVIWDYEKEIYWHAFGHRNENQWIFSSKNRCGMVNGWQYLPENPSEEKPTEQESYVGDKVWDFSVERIRKVVEDYLDMDDIKYSLLAAVSEGIREYFEEFSEREIHDIILTAIERKLELSDMKLSIKKRKVKK